MIWNSNIDFYDHFIFTSLGWIKIESLLKKTFVTFCKFSKNAKRKNTQALPKYIKCAGNNPITNFMKILYQLFVIFH